MRWTALHKNKPKSLKDKKVSKNKYAEFSKAANEKRCKDRMCSMKASFPDSAAAYQKGQKSYLCPLCKLWHRSGTLTSMVNELKSNAGNRKTITVTFPRLLR